MYSGIKWGCVWNRYILRLWTQEHARRPQRVTVHICRNADQVRLCGFELTAVHLQTQQKCNEENT